MQVATDSSQIIRFFSPQIKLFMILECYIECWVRTIYITSWKVTVLFNYIPYKKIDYSERKDQVKRYAFTK